MSEADRRARLADELRNRAADIRRIAAAIENGMRDPRAARPSPDQIFQWGLLKYIHDFYNAIEDSCYRVSNDINGELPGGPAGHAELLSRVLGEVPGKRRALFSAAVAQDLRDLKDLRHFFRHSYAAEADWTKVRQNVERVRRVAPQVARDLEEFADWLASGDPP